MIGKKWLGIPQFSAIKDATWQMDILSTRIFRKVEKESKAEQKRGRKRQFNSNGPTFCGYRVSIV
jgi:hypothetical protein